MGHGSQLMPVTFFGGSLIWACTGGEKNLFLSFLGEKEVKLGKIQKKAVASIN